MGDSANTTLVALCNLHLSGTHHDRSSSAHDVHQLGKSEAHGASPLIAIPSLVLSQPVDDPYPSPSASRSINRQHPAHHSTIQFTVTSSSQPANHSYLSRSITTSCRPFFAQRPDSSMRSYLSTTSYIGFLARRLAAPVATEMFSLNFRRHCCGA